MAGMAVLSVALGTGVLGILYGRRSRGMDMGDRLIVGFMAILGTAEAAHLAALFSGRAFADACRLFVVGIAALLLVSLGIWLWLRRGDVRKAQPKRGGNRRTSGGSASGSKAFGGSGGYIDGSPLSMGICLLFVILVIYQIVTVTSGDFVNRTGDMTVETVQSFLDTDGIYRVNPLTGGAYESGVPLRIRILGLPSLYGMLCRISGLSARELIWQRMPLFTMLMCYAAYWMLAKALFAGRGEEKKRMLFMALAAAVFCVGDYLYGMDGFGLLHHGFGGAAIRNLVLVPYLLGLAARHKWRPAFLCILAEICLVWTLYGMGVCLLVTGGTAALRLWQKRRAGGLHGAGEEDG